jgi:elongation factor G
MLALAGVVRRAGSVDDGNTVTDYLPAERERGITIQSAAISFPWASPDSKDNANVTISLIDTPGHVDFSVEVNRSVAVLDGAVLVVDSVAGVQAQTETVWRAMTRPSLNNHQLSLKDTPQHSHEPLPCLAVINKMDKEGCHFGNAIRSLRIKLPGANPIPIQMPIFQSSTPNQTVAGPNLIAIAADDLTSSTGDFAGTVDLIHMRTIVYPDTSSTSVSNVDACVPKITNLFNANNEPKDPKCPITQQAITARLELVEAMAECDERIEEMYLLAETQDPKPEELRAALRRITLAQTGLPVLCAAALRGKGVEPIIDAIAELLPSPLDRQPPELAYYLEDNNNKNNNNSKEPSRPGQQMSSLQKLDTSSHDRNNLGHPLNSELLALAFKVVHMKGRGGSGDGRVVFCRVYSGQLRERDTVRVLSPSAPGESIVQKPRKERIGGMLELSGGTFGNLQGGICKSGGVCALIGLKTVVTGDTIVMMPDRKSSSRKKKQDDLVCLMGVASPKPVLKVRLEAKSSEQQKRLSEALQLLAIEDPSLHVEESESATLLSGLGELHIEITLDRLQREFGLCVLVGKPSVQHRETITSTLSTDGLLNFERISGDVRLQAAIHLVLEPTWNKHCGTEVSSSGDCMVLADPIVTVSDTVKEFLGIDLEIPEEDLLVKSELYKSLKHGCLGALKRGPIGAYPMANMNCHIMEVDAEDGLSSLQTMPGSLRAAAAHAIASVLAENKDFCSVLEPKMSLEITLPNDMVGAVLSDLTGSRRGTIEDVLVGENKSSCAAKALIRGDVPLIEILGYANSLRSLTGGEGTFTAEYKGHSPCTN